MARLPPIATILRARLPDPATALPAAATAVMYTVAISALLLGPIWPVLGTEVLGDPDTDTVRGMWGFEHLRRSMIPPDTPLWSSQLHFPGGVLALVLPWISGLIVSPVMFMAGPIAGYNLALCILLIGAAMSTATLAKMRTSSWVAGAAVGGTVASAPMLLAGVCDGTPEHVSVWLLPLFFAAATSLCRRPTIAAGVVSGLLAGLIMLDSPYHSIYTLLIGVFVLPPELLGPWPAARRDAAPRAFGAALLTLLVVGLAIWALFQNFAIEPTSTREARRLMAMNAADLRTWWQYDLSGAPGRDISLPPTAIPVRVLWPMLGLALIGLPRSAPWLVAGFTCLALSFGLNDKLPGELGVWAGATGHSVGRSVYAFNSAMADLPGFESIRFPRRWMIPATMCFAVGAADGIGLLARLARKRSTLRRPFQLLGAVFVLASTCGALLAGRSTAGIDTVFPKHTLPSVEFAEWIDEHDNPGAVVLLPKRRPAPKSGLRQDLPVFANLSEALSSTDSLYLQVLMNRPIMGAPTLKTLAKMRNHYAIEQLLRNWDDICLPHLLGREIPKSAIDPQSAVQRRILIERLHEAGLGFVVVDEAAYGKEGLSILQTQLSTVLADTQHFDDGTGVTVFVLK